MWKEINFEENEDDSVEKIGAISKSIFAQLITDESTFEKSIFIDLVELSAEEGTAEAATELGQAYKDLAPPRWNDSCIIGQKLLSRLLDNFRDVICLELWKSEDLSYSSREIVTSLAPVIIVLLQIPTTLTIIAIPLSLVLARRGMAKLCKEMDCKRISMQQAKKQIELNEMALLFLQTEASLYSEEELPPLLRQAILQKENEIELLKINESDRDSNDG